jgi:hypothetical protein
VEWLKVKALSSSPRTSSPTPPYTQGLVGELKCRVPAQQEKNKALSSNPNTIKKKKDIFMPT